MTSKRIRHLIKLLMSKKQNKLFVAFPLVETGYWAGRVYDLCVYYMTGTPEGSTESGFIEKPGIEPATPGLQGIALIHYTTGASLIMSIGVLIQQRLSLQRYHRLTM